MISLNMKESSVFRMKDSLTAQAIKDTIIMIGARIKITEKTGTEIIMGIIITIIIISRITIEAGEISITIGDMITIEVMTTIGLTTEVITTTKVEVLMETTILKTKTKTKIK